MAKLRLCDSHCHLDFTEFAADRQEVVARALAAGVEAIIVPGVARQAAADVWLQQCQGVTIYRGVGLHPYFIAQHQLADLAWVEQQLQQHPAWVIGEVGLDKTCANYPEQQQLFIGQLELAAQYQRPLLIHHRQSQADLLKLIKPLASQLPAQPGILHAFSGSLQQAEQWLALGFKLGVGGVISYPRAQKTRATVAALPLDSLVLETDAPSMPLQGFQGQRNEPAQIARVLTELQELRTESVAELAAATWDNSMAIVANLG